MVLEDYEFKKILRFLKGIRGQGTELISIYIPPDYNIAELANKLRAEYSQASNIKSKQTRKNVLGAIERILQVIKGIPKPPEKGVAIFCGNISNQPGTSNIQLYIVHPPRPIPVQVYRCDSSFFLDPLLEMLEPAEVYGILLIDRREATLAYLKGKRIEIIQHRNSFVPSKHRAGGQCLHPDTLTILGDGDIKALGEDGLQSNKVASLSGFKVTGAEIENVFTRNADEWIRITTKYPAMTITTTPEHWFFVPSIYGMSLKQACDLDKGDYVFMARRIRIDGKEQKLNPYIRVRNKVTKPGILALRKRRKELGLSQKSLGALIGISQATVSKVELGKGVVSVERIKEWVKVLGLDWDTFKKKYVNSFSTKFPRTLTPELAQFLGYLTGDGNIEETRLRIYDEDLQNIKRYAELARKLFGDRMSIRKRSKRNYYILTVYGKDVTTNIKKLFPEVVTRKGIPKLVLKSKNNVVAAYISGLIDAEGCTNNRGISVSMASHRLIKETSMALLRLGIISSVRDKRVHPSIIRGKQVFPKPQLELLIADRDALKIAEQVLTLFSKKRKTLARLQKRATKTNQVPLSGRDILSLCRELKMDTMDFCQDGVSTNVFRDERNISFVTFERITNRLEERILNIENAPKTNIREFRRALRITPTEIANELKISTGPIYRLETDENYENPELEERVWEYLRDKQNWMITRGNAILKMFQEVLNGDLIKAKISNVDKIEITEKAIDLAVPRSESFVANGFLVHNSSVRFERLIEIAANEWFKKVGEMANQYFSDKVKGLIIGGPGPTKHYFINGDYLSQNLKNKIVGTVDTSYTDEFGVREVLEKSGEIIKGLAIVKEKELLNQFIKEASTDGLATYGEKEVRQALSEGKVDTLLVSEGLTWERIKFKCPQCGYTKEVTVKGAIPKMTCPKCGAAMQIEEEKDLIEELAKLAEETGAKLELISTDTIEGKQFLQAFGGIGALLRFK